MDEEKSLTSASQRKEYQSITVLNEPRSQYGYSIFRQNTNLEAESSVKTQSVHASSIC